MLEQPTYRKLDCWLASEAEAGGEGAWGFALVLRLYLENGVPSLLADHPPLASL